MKMKILSKHFEFSRQKRRQWGNLIDCFALNSIYLYEHDFNDVPKIILHGTQRKFLLYDFQMFLKCKRWQFEILVKFLKKNTESSTESFLKA